MSEQGTCEWCGGPIPPRDDPRGRKPRFCSDACRAAATRDRNKREHAAELEQARTQTSIDLRGPGEVLTEAVDTVRSATISLRDDGTVPDRLRDLVDAAQDLAQAAEKIQQESPTPTPTSRRRKRRRAVRKSGT